MSLRDATRPHTQIASVNPHIVYSQTSEKCAQKLNAVIEEVKVRIKSEKKADNKKISDIFFFTKNTLNGNKELMSYSFHSA